ncbi:MAG: DNA primase [Gammaproteobacteria bacterium]|nr:DNA primase [Gammaproteobacteria bacterium]NNJ73488.1 DNA primase [Enterobacterales bacterium]
MTGRIPQAFIDDVLARTDLVELINSRVPLTKAGTNHKACCPFHQEKTPSFNVNGNKQFYHCFGCGASGNAISFVMDYDRLEFPDAVDELAGRLGMEVPRDALATPSVSPGLYDLMSAASDYYYANLRKHRPAMDYIKQRELSEEVIDNYKLGYAYEAWDGLRKQLAGSDKITHDLVETGMLVKNDNGKIYDRFRDRLMFPIRDRRGKVIAFGGRIINDGQPKYLNSPETPIFHKGRELYGFFEARQANRKLERMVIVEGYMDVVALAQFGVTYAVATLGTATSESHLQQLFKTVNEIIFSFDGDQAGQAAAWKAMEIALPLIRGDRMVRFMFLPEEDDPDSYIRKHGKAHYEKELVESMPLSEYLLTSLSENTDLSVAEDRSRFIARMQTYLEKATDPIYREMLMEAVAQKLDMHPEQIRASLGVDTVVTNKQNTQTSSHVKSMTPMRMLITLLVQNPELASEVTVTDWLLQVQTPGADLLKQILDILHSRPHLTTGALIEHWRDQQQYKQLQRLATWEHLIETDETRQEVFRDAISKVFAEIRQTRRDELLAKRKSRGLDDAETEELRELLASKA